MGLRFWLSVLPSFCDFFWGQKGLQIGMYALQPFLWCAGRRQKDFRKFDGGIWLEVPKQTDLGLFVTTMVAGAGQASSLAAGGSEGNWSLVSP